MDSCEKFALGASFVISKTAVVASGSAQALIWYSQGQYVKTLKIEGWGNGIDSIIFDDGEFSGSDLSSELSAFSLQEDNKLFITGSK